MLNNPTLLHPAFLSEDDKSWWPQFLKVFCNTRDDKDIEQVIMAHKQAATCLLLDNPRLGRFLNNIGIGYQKHYERFGRLDDLQTAITTKKKSNCSNSRWLCWLNCWASSTILEPHFAITSNALGISMCFQQPITMDTLVENGQWEGLVHKWSMQLLVVCHFYILNFYLPNQ